MSSPVLFQLSWRPYRFVLPKSLITSRGALVVRSGWLLRLTGPDGCFAWGEAAQPLLQRCDAVSVAAVSALPQALDRVSLEQCLPRWPVPLACALGMALAEFDGLGSVAVGGWRTPPASAWLLPAGEEALPVLARLLNNVDQASNSGLTFKWKVAVAPEADELELLEVLLEMLPASARLRLDANGGWDRWTASRWADRLHEDDRLEWLEQPLAPNDLEGLRLLAQRIPVALDESIPLLTTHQQLDWPGWLVRRPLQEADPRPLIRTLQTGAARQMISTAFETGIGRRFVSHLAAIQSDGLYPTAPGLAPAWLPEGDLFSSDPQKVWEAAG